MKKECIDLFVRFGSGNLIAFALALLSACELDVDDPTLALWAAPLVLELTPEMFAFLSCILIPVSVSDKISSTSILVLSSSSDDITTVFRRPGRGCPMLRSMYRKWDWHLLCLVFEQTKVCSVKNTKSQEVIKHSCLEKVIRFGEATNVVTEAISGRESTCRNHTSSLGRIYAILDAIQDSRLL